MLYPWLYLSPAARPGLRSQGYAFGNLQLQLQASIPVYAFDLPQSERCGINAVDLQASENLLAIISKDEFSWYWPRGEGALEMSDLSNKSSNDGQPAENRYGVELCGLMESWIEGHALKAAVIYILYYHYKWGNRLRAVVIF